MYRICIFFCYISPFLRLDTRLTVGLYHMSRNLIMHRPARRTLDYRQRYRLQGRVVLFASRVACWGKLSPFRRIDFWTLVREDDAARAGLEHARRLTFSGLLWLCAISRLIDESFEESYGRPKSDTRIPLRCSAHCLLTGHGGLQLSSPSGYSRRHHCRH